MKAKRAKRRLAPAPEVTFTPRADGIAHVSVRGHKAPCGYHGPKATPEPPMPWPVCNTCLIALMQDPTVAVSSYDMGIAGEGGMSN
jgi:hypothetical protein